MLLNPGTLYVVATPIGNLEDVTYRAVRVLGSVDLIAAEDTRRAGKLLARYGVATPRTSLHEHNEAQKTDRLLERLARGETIALVSDAGTPLVSDPGARLVREAHGRGLRVEALPGPSALLAALVSSGLAAASFTFAGFPPFRSHARTRWFAALAREPRPFVFFEAPHRIEASLRDLHAAAGERTIAVCRELTKLHEQSLVGAGRRRARAPDEAAGGVHGGRRGGAGGGAAAGRGGGTGRSPGARRGAGCGGPHRRGRPAARAGRQPHGRGPRRRGAVPRSAARGLPGRAARR